MARRFRMRDLVLTLQLILTTLCPVTCSNSDLSPSSPQPISAEEGKNGTSLHGVCEPVPGIKADVLQADNLHSGHSDRENRLRCGEESGIVVEHQKNGTVRFWAPCCARFCQFAIHPWPPTNSSLLVEFLHLDLPSPHTISSDKFCYCNDAAVYFPGNRLQLCGKTVPKPLKVSSSSILVRTERNAGCRDFISFTLKLRVCEETKGCPFQHTVTGEGTSGSIEASRHIEDVSMPRFIVCKWDIQVPQNSVLHISLTSSTVLPFNDSLSISTKDQPDHVQLKFQQPLILGLREHFVTLPSNEAVVSYDAMGYRDQNKGFKLRYRAVSPDTYVPIIDEFTLNCTGREHSLPEHILCDVREDCLDREDEKNCSYRDETLCPGGIVFESGCYHVLPHNGSDLTWRQEEEICRQEYKGHLVTPNTQEELSFLYRLSDLSFFGEGSFLYRLSDLSFFGEGVCTLGVRQISSGKDFLYRKLLQGLDGSSLFNLFPRRFTCAHYACMAWTFSVFSYAVINIPCDRSLTAASNESTLRLKTICERKMKPLLSQEISLPVSDNVWTRKMDTFQCVEGKERILLSRQCDGVSDCFNGSDDIGCDSLTRTSEHFSCDSGKVVWFSHVCDDVNDCEDNSDEEFCGPWPEEDLSMTVCASGTAVPASSWCDAKADCLDGSDEMDCLSCNGDTVLCPSVGCFPPQWADDDSLDCPIHDKNGHWIIESTFVSHSVLAQPPPGVVMPDGYGKVTIQPLSESDPCPSTHAQCPRGYCIPIYLLCNGHKDCPEGEDELTETCTSFCRGRYKCHQSAICLHDDHVCDGLYHCPLHDDERF